MRAIIIAVGSEMLNLDRVDTNSLYIGRRLREKGILTDLKMVAGDHVDNLTWAVKKACKHAQLVVITGGLGPTEDDITREAVANALKKKLIFRDDIVTQLQELFRCRGMAMPEINTRQAFVIEGAEVIANALGTAPGQLLDAEHCKVLLLPGPPAEMTAMFDEVLETRLGPLCNYFCTTHTFKLAGITESETDALIAPEYTSYPNPQTTILATPGVIEIHLLGRSRKSVNEALRLTEELATKLRGKLAPYLFAEDDISLEAHVLDELKKRKLTLAVAESCTGGSLGSLLTSIPGSSEAFLGGVIAYANTVKEKVLGVPADVLKAHGSVSEAIAAEMAAAVRRITGADIGVGITGIAGPTGGSADKPIGLVFISLSSGRGNRTVKHRFGGDRQTIRLRSARTALNLVRLHLLETDEKAGNPS